MRRDEAISILSKRRQIPKRGAKGEVGYMSDGTRKNDGGKEEKETGREAPWPFLGNFAAGNNNTTGKVTVTILEPVTPRASLSRVGLPADPRCPNNSVCSGIWMTVEC